MTAAELVGVAEWRNGKTLSFKIFFCFILPVPLASFGDTELETQLLLSREAAAWLEKERDEACEAERKTAAELQSKL
jgi:hypothetical protein